MSDPLPIIIFGDYDDHQLIALKCMLLKCGVQNFRPGRGSSFKQKLLTEEFADFFEDALNQATRAMSDDRIEYIASLLKKRTLE